ncbi:DUF4113 domain-containing protein [Methylopila sp. Yamaguchi]|uniref:DUF4113 domain-containing protein n=1 Tax=Methylopila sp. Yamaguchi TaxID=1437817 RepID=UPI0011AF8C86|nr:DUF4113 domain-containing protein [Methylopila sp. Yamaguchi]
MAATGATSANSGAGRHAGGCRREEAVKKPWATKFEMRSPRCDRVDELPVARAV